MQAPTDDNSIVLVGSAPLSGTAAETVDEASRALRECTGEVVVFFHGNGVDHAMPGYSDQWVGLSGDSRLRLEVCSAAWQRRHSHTLLAPFVISSLVRFWHRLATGYRIAGRGTHAPEESSLADPWVVRIDSVPSEPDSRERLEMVLAGVSLDLPITLVFTGEGRQHLVGGWGRQWRQLVDFDLARVHVLGDGDLESELPVEVLDEEGLERLTAGARGVLVL